jgi:ankyrin repeat protein
MKKMNIPYLVIVIIAYNHLCLSANSIEERNLFRDAGDGNVCEVSRAIQKRVNVNAKRVQTDRTAYWPDDTTALHQAAEWGRLEVAQLLLENKALLDVFDGAGKTPLMRAIVPSRKSAGMIELFLRHNVDVNLQEKGVFEVYNGNTALIHAIKWRKEKAAWLLLNNRVDVNAIGEHGMTALHHAAKCSSPEFIKRLLLEGAAVDARVSYDEMRYGKMLTLTALWIALGGEKMENFRCLLESGADPNVKISHGITLLHDAAKNGCLEVIKPLLEKNADIEAQDVYGRTPLMYACLVGNSNCVELLLKKGANVNAQRKNSKNKSLTGRTALMIASGAGNLEIVQQLLNAGAKVDSKGRDDETALHDAVKNGQIEIIELLLAKDAEIDATNIFGATPLLCAVKRKSYKVAEFLLKNGAGVNVRTTDFFKCTPLSLVINDSNFNMIELLIKHGADLNNVIYAPPLYEIVKTGRIDLVQLMLEHNAHPNEVNKYNNKTPLHKAAKRGYKEIAELLLKEGADKTIKDKENKTPADIAREKGYEELASIIDTYDSKS